MTQHYAILLVAGRKADVELVQQTLDGAPFTYDLDIIKSYRPALDQLQQGTHDVCFVDQQIGKKTGLQLIRQATALRSPIALILLANEDDPALDAAALDAGASAFLTKPELTTNHLARSLRYAVNARHTAKHQRRLAEQYLGILQEQAEFIGRFTTDFKLTFVNAAYRDWFQADDLVGSDLLDYILPEDHENVIAHLRTLTPEAPVAVNENRSVLPDGSVRWTQWTNHALYDADGHLLEYQAVGRDITEAKMQAQALRESEERYRAIVEDHLDFIVRWKPGGIRTFVNDAYCRYFDTPHEELIGTSFFPYILEEDRTKVRDRLAKLSPENPSSYDVHRVRRADGSIGWNEWVDRAIFDGEGKIIEIQSVGRDITERALAEEVIRESEARYRSLVELSPDAIIVMVDEELAFANTAAARYFGVASPEHLIGTKIVDFVLARYHDTIREQLQIVLKKGRTNRPIEGKIISLDGRLMDVEAHGVAIAFQGQQAVLAIVRDISTRKATENALRESEERYRTLFEGINDAIFVHDEDANILEVNEATCRRLGYTRDELLKMKTTDIDAPDYAARFADRWNQQVSVGYLGEIEGSHITKDGRTIFVDVNSTLITYDGKRAVLAVARDVSAMRDAEQALFDRHRELESVARVARAVTSSLDIEPMLVEVAQVICELLDVTTTFVFDVDFDTNTMTVLAEHFSEYAGKDERESRKGKRYSLAERPSVRALQENPDTIVHWQHDDPALSETERKFFEGRGLYTALDVPLRAGGSAIGFLTLWESRYERKFNESEIRLLQSVGGMVGVSLAKAQLYEKLAASEERYRSLVELSPDAVLVLADMRIVYINRAGLDLYGAESIDQIIGMPILDRVPHNLHEMVTARIANALSTDTPLPTGRSQALRLDGEIVDVDATGVGLKYGEQRAVLALLRDVSEQRRTEERLQHYAYLLENVSDAIISMDTDLRIATWNPAAEVLYGWSEEEMIGQDLYKLVPTDYVDTTWQAFMDQFLGTGHWKGEVIRTRKDGRRVHVLVSINAIRDEFREIVGSVGIHTDITVIKHAEQNRLDLTRERDRVNILQRFVGDATHDLNTPLTNIRSTLYLLSRAIDEDNRDKYMYALAAQTDKLEKLLGSMLAMARLDDPATAELKFNRHEVNPIVQDVAAQLAPTIERKQHRLVYGLSDDLPQVRMDRGEMMRSAEEILLNAVNYTPNGGQITLRTRLDEGFVVVEIQDTGIGISAEELPHIFERFYRADRARSSETGGAGLGLSLAHKIVEAHDGRIEVTSTIGQGSTFCIWLPLSDD